MRAKIFAVQSIVVALFALVACQSPPTQPGPVAGEPISTIGRWSGSYTGQDQMTGGQARVSIGADSTLTGSLVDSIWQRAHGVARTGIISGSLTAGVAQVTIAWSSGQTEKFEGMASAPSYGSMGINLRQYGPDGNFAKGANLAFALHEQGVAAGPPYGVPPTTQPNFMTQYVGRWIANFHTADGNAGTGSATIDSNGEVQGALVDDAWADSSAGQSARHGLIVGTIDDSGKLVLALTWSGSAPITLQGVGYFGAPESLVFQMGTDIEAVRRDGPALTMTLGRN